MSSAYLTRSSDILRALQSPESPLFTHFPTPALSSSYRFPFIERSYFEVGPEDEGKSTLSRLRKYWAFTGLIPTTAASSILLASELRRWTFTGRFYDAVVTNRASAQVIVQIISTVFGVLHVIIICLLINYSVRIKIESSPTSLDTLRLWHNMLSKQVDWTLPLTLLLLLLGFLVFCIIPTVLWVGANTPIETTVSREQPIQISSYSNTSLLTQSYRNGSGPSGGASLNNAKGYFTYNIGEELLAPLISSASSATTADGSVPQLPKLDSTHYTYSGRSYGVGSSVGLTDNNILANRAVTSYAFQENGYNPIVSCIYNTSSTFALSTRSQDAGNTINVASGFLPNSNGPTPETGIYIGFGTQSIVALGVALSPNATGRIVSIAAGDNYPNLNNTQCNIVFAPTLFQIHVSTSNRSICVRPTSSPSLGNVPNIEPTGFLTYVATYQLKLLSTAVAAIYSSPLGDAFNTSIDNFRSSTSVNALPDNDIALFGLQNSIAALTDNILGSYAAAQLQIAKTSQPTTASIRISALKFGEGYYIYAIFILNSLVIFAVLFEGFRTKMWRELQDDDFMDFRDVMVGASRGGESIARAVDEWERRIKEWKGGRREEVRGLGIKVGRGRIKGIFVVKDGRKWVLARGLDRRPSREALTSWL
ncbi:hypothetical protein B7494_g3880 [Chlorociboria aeruginascens]|nr:hypothetical protein B7494_g3880 [Chlorociboria aeruginascens]